MNNITTSRLAEIANTVNAEHNELEAMLKAALKNSMARAVNIGGLLTEAKELAGHGNWGAWLKNNCQFSERTAQNYMRVFASYPELSKSATVADLTYKQALNLLTEPKAKELEIHEICAMYPMTEEDIEFVADGMRQVGYEKLFPITLYEGKILDGKLRYEAAKRAGVTPIFTTFEGDYESALKFTVRKNTLRKSYTEDMRAGVAVRFSENTELQNALQYESELLTAQKELDALDAELKTEPDIRRVLEITKEAERLYFKTAELKVRAERGAGKCLNILESAGGDV